MKKQTITTVLTFSIFLTFTGSVSAKLRYYKNYACSTVGQAYQCATGCYVDPDRPVDVMFEFLVNSAKGMIMLSAYKDGNLVGSSTYEDCKVFDEKKLGLLKRNGLFVRSGLYAPHTKDG